MAFRRSVIFSIVPFVREPAGPVRWVLVHAPGKRRTPFHCDQPAAVLPGRGIVAARSHSKPAACSKPGLSEHNSHRWACAHQSDGRELARRFAGLDDANINSRQPGTNVRAWLFVILKNVFRNDESGPPPLLSAQQHHHLVLSEVQTAFLQLRVDHREVLSLIAIEGLQYEEAARVLNISVGTVKSRLSRARAALRALVDVPSPPVRPQPAMEPVREAHDRGMQLLAENLSPAQRAQLKKHRHFDVIGGETRRRYRIRLGWQANVKLLDRKGREVRALCFLPRGNLVIGDILLAQKVALELFESDALKVANKFPPDPLPC